MGGRKKKSNLTDIRIPVRKKKCPLLRKASLISLSSCRIWALRAWAAWVGSEKKRTKYLVNREGIIFKVSGQAEGEKKEQDKKDGELVPYEEGGEIFKSKVLYGSVVSD